MAKKSATSKRRISDTEVATEVLSHQSLQNQPLSDKIDDLSEPTMGEKLLSHNLEGNDRALNHDNVDASSQLKPPSADSVYVMLKQALRADDRALLIDCLYRQDDKVITNSLSLLNPTDVLKFLQSLVSIIQLRGAVLACALPWLRSILLLHAGSIMSQESSLDALNSIYQLIEFRGSTFNRALQLSSCLDLLYAETVDYGADENDLVASVIYEDDDESDDEGSDHSMEVDDAADSEEPQAYSDDGENGEISD